MQSDLPNRYVETRRHKKNPVKIRVTNFGKKIKYSKVKVTKKERNEEGKKMEIGKQPWLILLSM